MNTMSANQETRSISTNTLNRCDRCGAQAYAYVLLKSGQDLMFCGHHWRDVEPKISPLADTLIDETGYLAADANLVPTLEPTK